MLKPIGISFLAAAFLGAISVEADVLVAAHRGASLAAPENTLLSFTKAIEFKADCLELDVYSSSDDSLMVMHDATVDRTTNGTGKITSMTYAALRKLDAGQGQKIPTLSEVLKLAKDRIKVCAENKGASTPDLIAVIRKFGMDTNVVVMDFDYARLQQQKKLAPDIDILFLVSTYADSNVNKLKSLSGQILGPGAGVTAAALAYAHSKNIAVWQWTVDDRKTMETLVNLKIDGIISNDPKLARTVVDSIQALTTNLKPRWSSYRIDPGTVNIFTGHRIDGRVITSTNRSHFPAYPGASITKD